MNDLKQKLGRMKNEESDLLDKCRILDELIKAIQHENDMTHIEMRGQTSRAKLIEHELDKKKSELDVVLAKINENEYSNDIISKSLKNLTENSENHVSREEDLTAELTVLQEELHSVQRKTDEMLRHLSHVEGKKNTEERRAELAEEKLNSLELEHERIKTKGSIRNEKVENDLVDELESQLHDVQERLKNATSEHEDSIRTLNRLKREISNRKSEISRQEVKNNQLQDELHGVLDELPGL